MPRIQQSVINSKASTTTIESRFELSTKDMINSHKRKKVKGIKHSEILKSNKIGKKGEIHKKMKQYKRLFEHFQSNFKTKDSRTDSILNESKYD